MFKFRFVCTDKDSALQRVNQAMINDRPRRKAMFGGDLYRKGIHFRECGESVRGFYLSENEDESTHGNPPRVCFTGKFVLENDHLYFDVYIHPRIFEVLLIMCAAVSLTFWGEIFGFIVSAVFLFIFSKEYINLIKAAYEELYHIFNR